MRKKNFFSTILSLLILIALIACGYIFFKDMDGPSIAIAPDTGRVSPHTPLQITLADPSNIRTLIEQHELITLGGSRYLLVEFDFGLPGSVLLRTLEAIAQRGLVPVVAHPERYDAVQRDPGLAAWCFSRGMLLQLNKGSLLGLLGSRAEDTALHLLSHGLAHLIASDAHDDRFRTTGFRSLLPVLEPICHPDYIALLLHGNPRRILRDEPIPIPPLQSD